MTVPDLSTASFDAAWIAAARRDGTTTAKALDFFDSLAPVPLDFMIGRWRGSGFHTGHLLDGMLEVLGWYGKRFVDAETVDPLLFGDEGRLVAVNPARVPLATVTRLRLKPSPLLRVLFNIIRPLLVTSAPCARLRMTEYRGKTGATMIYDAHPINDVFRRIDDNTLLGLMDYREFAAPFFFILERR
jgi:hypothetical protein